ncbi:Cx9C motif-containing protein 4, partial [Talaromyces pinophilus]
GNLKDDLAYDPPCHPRACAIQGELSPLNDFQLYIDRCQAQIDALYECCNAFYKERGEDAKTPSCPKATLLRVKMKQRAQQS